MEKLDAIEILRTFNFESQGITEDGYDLYSNGSANIWVGSWYLENENEPVALPYRESGTTDEDIFEFIKL